MNYFKSLFFSAYYFASNYLSGQSAATGSEGDTFTARSESAFYAVAVPGIYGHTETNMTALACDKLYATVEGYQRGAL